MFLAEKAPEWKDGECCHRCRVQFSMVQRKVRMLFQKLTTAFLQQSRCSFLFHRYIDMVSLFVIPQHHCRNCGQIFCAKCSSKNSIIPKFGIEREVRVCDSCFETLNK